MDIIDLTSEPEVIDLTEESKEVSDTESTGTIELDNEDIIICPSCHLHFTTRAGGRPASGASRLTTPFQQTSPRWRPWSPPPLSRQFSSVGRSENPGHPIFREWLSSPNRSEWPAFSDSGMTYDSALPIGQNVGIGRPRSNTVRKMETGPYMAKN